MPLWSTVAILAAGIVAAGPAIAQTSAPATTGAPLSLNLGAGVVGSTADVAPGSVGLLSVGTDIRFTPRWSIRIEAGRRLPTNRTFTTHSIYSVADPDAPSDRSRFVEVQSTTRVEERWLADLAVLVRAASRRHARFEVAALAGLDLQVVRSRWHTTIPQSLTDPVDVLVLENTARRMRGVFDLGVEGGVHVSPRSTLLVHGLIGFQSPYEEHPRRQLRAGVIFKRHF